MTASGMKNMRTTSTSHITIFAIQPPWCHESRLSFWSFTPIIIRANVAKNKKFPKLTRRTACVWYHSFVRVVSDWFIPIIKHTQIFLLIMFHLYQHSNAISIFSFKEPLILSWARFLNFARFHFYHQTQLKDLESNAKNWFKKKVGLVNHDN